MLKTIRESLRNHYRLTKEMLFPTEAELQKLQKEDFAKKTIQYTFILLGLYVLLNISIYLLNYKDMQVLNEMLRKTLEKQPTSKIHHIFSIYPYNIVYILISLFAFEVYMILASYLFLYLFGEKNRNIKTNTVFSIYSNTYILLSIFLIFLTNTFYPITDEPTKLRLAILLGLWIFYLLWGIYYSGKYYYRLAKDVYEQNRNIILLSWNLPFLFLGSYMYLALSS